MAFGYFLQSAGRERKKEREKEREREKKRTGKKRRGGKPKKITKKKKIENTVTSALIELEGTWKKNQDISVHISPSTKPS